MVSNGTRDEREWGEMRHTVANEVRMTQIGQEDSLNRISISDGKDYLDWREGSGGTVEIFDVVVNSDRRKGRGRVLVSILLAQLPAETKVWAITRSDNDIGILWYEAMRFRVCGVLREFYRTERGVDAIMFIREAGGPV